MTPPTDTAAITAAEIPEQAVGGARLMGHAYDGIHEYDNPMPGWWKITFCATVVFAACYGFYFHVVDWGRMPDETYAGALAEYDEGREARERADAMNVSETSLAEMTKDASTLARGAAIFAAKCVACHQPDGSGLIGPNLTDQFQLRGDTRMDIFGTVHRGSPGTAMLAWGEQLAPRAISDVVAYVITLRGKNLPGKLREGHRVQPFANVP
ncbi:MAG TPA: cbb3-type cytochrome c oxidase N-terminal domain-containing protein [Kofleriaceae bacterium]